MKYERMLFGMKISDASCLAKAIQATETLASLVLQVRSRGGSASYGIVCVAVACSRQGIQTFLRDSLSTHYYGSHVDPDPGRNVTSIDLYLRLFDSLRSS